MTPRVLVERWSRRLAVTAAACALGLGTGVAGLVQAIAAAMGATSASAWILALAAGVAVALADAWRRLAGWLTPTRVALWLEERAPSLQFALVAAVEGSDPTGWCAAQVRAVDVATPGWRALRRALAWPLAAAALGAVAWLVAPRLATTMASRASRRVPAAPTTGPLHALRARLVPPPYAARPAQEVREPEVLRPLAGSTVELRGPRPPAFAPADLTVAIDGDPTKAQPDGGEWLVRFAADSATHVVRLSHAASSRLVVVEPVADSLPAVSLERPSRDTVVREARGTLALRARASDDVGLAGAAFEYIVSSGEGERFTFRSGTLGAVRLSGSRTADLAATLDLRALRLGPGDVVHLRAVARDANTMSGPGVGASETRTLRVARAGEYDSVAVDPAAPPAVDQSLLSQRMLINLTEALVRKARTMDSGAMVSASRRVARDQARLRQQVSDLVFSRLGDRPSGEHFHGDGHAHGETEPLRRDLTPSEVLAAAEKATGSGSTLLDVAHDETPVVAINRPLLEAYNAMWEAGRELESGRPRSALPPMYVALAAIQRARAAERLYLRGTPRPVVVDVRRSRLAGRERGESVRRAAVDPAPPLRRLAAMRLERALATRPPGAAADSLLLLRVSLAGRLPEVARALDALIGDVRAGRRTGGGAARVRRALDRGTSRADTTALWGGPSGE